MRDAQSGTIGNQQMVEVFAAGNEGDAIPGPENEGYGSISEEGSAKNVITVGASEGVRASGTDGCGTTNADADVARDIIDFSSRGPTDDGRLKPDLVAPGTHVTGARPPDGDYTRHAGPARPSSQRTYSLVSGTSQAAPQVAGAAALVREWFGPILGSPPSPAMTKALLVNTATDLAGGDNGKGDTIAGGPNADQGWGRVNLGSTFDSTTRQLYDQQPSTFDASGETADVRTFAVPDASKPIKVTLAWTDAPGPFDGNAFVNDLDLDVDAGGRPTTATSSPAATRARGGAPIPATTSRASICRRDVRPRSVTVRPTTIAGDGVPGNGDGTDQDYALVVSNATEQDGPVLVHQATTIDDSGPAATGTARSNRTSRPT